MYKEITKAIIAMALSTALFSSCDSAGEKPAGALLEEARQCADAGQYAQAMALIDSLNKTYPAAVKARRASTALMPAVTEKATLKELASADSLVAALQLQGESQRDDIVFVSNPIEGYYVGKSAKGIDPNSTAGLHGRLSADGHFYIIATSPKAVKSTSVSVTVNGQEAASAVVAYDGERNDRSSGREIITFIEAECDSIGKLIAANPGAEVNVAFHGNSATSMKLPANQAEAIAKLYDAGATIRESKIAQLNKARLEKRLEVARSQMARTFDDAKAREAAED